VHRDLWPGPSAHDVRLLRTHLPQHHGPVDGHRRIRQLRRSDDCRLRRRLLVRQLPATAAGEEALRPERAVHLPAGGPPHNDLNRYPLRGWLPRLSLIVLAWPTDIL